jgi:hypothetical protein
MNTENTPKKEQAGPRRASADGSDAAVRNIKTGFFGMTCTRCGMLFESEIESEDHLNGPACEPKQPNSMLNRTRGFTENELTPTPDAKED